MIKFLFAKCQADLSSRNENVIVLPVSSFKCPRLLSLGWLPLKSVYRQD